MHYIWKEWKESVKSKGLWLSVVAILLVSIGILVKSSMLSFDQGMYILLLNLFDTFIYLIPILCLFIGAFSIFQEKEQKTLVMLLTRSDSYASFLWKKSIAVHSVLLVPVIGWFFLFIIPVKFMFQIDFKTYSIFLLSLCCLILIFTQIGIAIGSISRSRMQIVGLAILSWFYLFFIRDFLLLSYLPSVTYESVKLFSVAYFLNPIQAGRIFLETGLGVYSFGHMSKLLETFMWAKPSVFLIGNLSLLLAISYLIAVGFHRKECSE